MRYLHFLILLLFAACGTKNTVTINGTIVHPAAPFIQLSLEDTVYIVDVDTIGKLSTVLDLAEPKYFSASYGGRFFNLYLEPGDDIIILFDADDVSQTIKYDGTGAAANNYMAMSARTEKSVPTWDEIMILDEAGFFKKLDSIKKVKEDLLTLNQSQFSREFLEKENAKITYELADMMTYYPTYHSQLLMDSSFKVSSSFYHILEDIPLDKPNLLGLYQFENFVCNMVNIKLNETTIGSLSMNDVFLNSFDLTDQLIKDTLVQNMVYGRNFDSFLTSIGYDDGMEAYQKYKDRLFPKDRNRIIITLNELKKISKGQPSPNFQFASIYGDTISREDLLGKFVYINVWATWSKPCIAEIPKLEILQRKLKGKVQFISISVDSYIEPWKTMVRAEGMKDIQLYATNSWGDDFMTTYIVSSVPRYILLDPEGNIVNSVAASPSEGAEQQILDAIKPYGI